MSAWIAVLVAVAGGAGAATRFVLDGVITSRLSSRIPLGTFLINISGSFALGLVVGLTLSHALAPEVRAVAATGFLGGYTTFSTASTQTVDLIRKGKHGTALIYSGGMFIGALIAAAGGTVLGGLYGR